MADESDYRQTYDDFWAGILDAPGVDREDQLRRELHDYKFLMGEVPKVYEHVSGCRISKPNTMAFEVIGQHNEVFIGKETVAHDLRMYATEASDVDELRQLVTDYARDLAPPSEVA